MVVDKVECLKKVKGKTLTMSITYHFYTYTIDDNF